MFYKMINPTFRVDPYWDNDGLIYPWQKWFAWHPVKLNNKLVWFKFVYRRRIVYTIKGGEKFEYGTLFDMLKE